MHGRRVFLRRLTYGAAGAFAGTRGIGLAGQQVDWRGKVFRTGAELVPTAVTVRDADGRLVTALGRDDFDVSEDGLPQRVTLFSRERVPVSLALVMDVSDSMRGQRITDAREAIVRFLVDQLMPEDEAALVSFNHATNLLSAWTQNREPLLTALGGLRPTGGTAMYDAVATVLPLFESRTHPRAAVLLVSDGADTASDTTITILKQQLAREDIFLYAIGIDTVAERSSTHLNPYALRELTGSSGGYAEVITSSADIKAATTRIADELNHQYMLGYTPERAGTGGYHAIRVRVRQTDYVVRARRGVVR
jgi:Ca-activated chloride channel family protein